MTEPQSPLDEVRSLTRAMLEGAHAQDWVTVANLESVRAALLREVFEGAAHPSPEQLAAVAREVLDSDSVLIALGEQARDGVSTELAQLRQSRKLRSAYAENGSE